MFKKNTSLAVLGTKSSLIEKHIADLDHPLKNSIEKLLFVSDYALRNVHLLKNLLKEDPCTSLLPRADYFTALEILDNSLLQDHYMARLRQFRNTHFLRLLLLEIAGFANIEAIMRSWSDCADAIIINAINYSMNFCISRYGIPLDDEGKEAQLFALAMGKLGGRELNYSSDVDLIFVFTKVGYTHGREVISNQQFFSKVVQQFLRILQNITPDGFVFRVDLRLRPNGDSGPLVFSLTAMETYYQEQGRDWERYAMVKARVIDEDPEPAYLWFQNIIIPFVYRRYVDFSVIESLRSMKAMIEREIQLNPRLDDIKRGKGGIREVEFIIQNFQLIRGGRFPQLQQQNTLLALETLKQEKLLPHAHSLKQAYLYLRQLENILQSLNDQQTHCLPEDEINRAQVLLAMGNEDWHDLLANLHKYQRIVRESFHAVLGEVEACEDEQRLLNYQLYSLWHGHIESSMAINLLASLKFTNPEHCYQMIHTFRHGSRCRRLTQSARMRLDRFIILLLTELTHCSRTDELLVQVIHLLENIVGRSAYLALLTENPHALQELLVCFTHSPFITSLLVNHPFLLEILLDQEKDWHPYSRKKLEKILQQKLVHSSDFESQEEILRQFKLTHWLMAIRAEFYGYCNAVRIGQFLADIAQVIIMQVLDLAIGQLAVKYTKIKKIKSHFAIIAYGKLGSREMNYTSDLDLVFLHSMPASEETLVTRLTQKIVHMLTTRSQMGVLYSVDTRLRPSGAAGLLVSHFDAFVTYQKNQAWTWEHQALLKARVLSGSASIKQKFLRLKKEILSCPRERAVLKTNVLEMRTKINQHQKSNSFKYSRGGLLDLEFLIQFLILDLQEPLMAQYTHPLNHMRYLLKAGILTAEQFKLLEKAYRKYHYLFHQKIVQNHVIEDTEIAQKVASLCDLIYGSIP